MDTNEPGREPTEPTDAERFERWWNDEGSGIAPYDGEEHCFHAERVSRIAWLNGAYFAQARVAELEAELARYRDAITWALGTNGGFEPTPTMQGAFWWRNGLCARAGITWDGEKWIAAPGKEPTDADL